MSNGDWNHLNDLFHQAMEQPAAHREDFVRNADVDPDVLQMLLNCLKFADGEGLQAPLQPDQNPILFAANSEALLSDATSQIGDMLATESAMYRLDSVIGAGGTGVVYLATQTADSNQVAIKILRNELTDSETVRRRFDLERQLLEQLDHTSVGQILDSGSTTDGRPFLVMELIHGLSITDYAYQHQLALRPRLQLFQEACQAVAFAHSRGIVHRDIKPNHILVTADGSIKLVDFGIAKADSVATSLLGLTRMGDSPMTPAYASPEQVLGKPVGVESDVYSLGVVLFQLITGQHPYPTSTNLLEMAARICNQTPSRPSGVKMIVDADPRATDVETSVQQEEDVAPSKTDVAQTIPFPLSQLKGDLDEIVLKALRKEARLRYRTVYELSDDIDRYLENKPVTARRENRIYSLRKFVGQYWTLFLLLAMVLGSLVAALVVSQTALQNTEIARQEAQRNFEAKQFNVATSYVEQGLLEDGYQLLRPFLVDASGNLQENIAFEQRLLLQRISQDLDLDNRTVLPKLYHRGEVLLGSQQKLAIVSRQIHETQFTLFDVPGLLAGDDPEFATENAFHFLSRYFVSALVFAPQANRVIYSADERRMLVLGEANTGRILQELPVENHLKIPDVANAWAAHLTISQDEKWVASIDTADQLSIWELAEDSVRWVETVTFPSLTAHCIEFSPDGSQIAWAGENQLLIYDRSPLQLRHQISLPKFIDAIAWHPTLPQIVATTSRGDVQFFSTIDGQLQRSWQESTFARNIDISHDGQLLAEACVDGTVYLKRWDDGAVVKKIAALSTAAADVRFVDESRVLVAVDRLHRVLCWPVPGRTSAISERIAKEIQPPFETLNVSAKMAGCFATHLPPGIVAAADSSHIFLWNSNDGSLLKRVQVSTGTVWGVDFSPDGKYLASYEFDRERGNTMHLINAQSGEVVLSEVDRGDVAFSKFDSLILNTNKNPRNALRMRSLESPTEPTLITVDYPPKEIGFANQERLVAVAGDDMVVRIYRYSAEGLTLDQEIPVPELGTQVRALTFSPDDGWLAMGGSSREMIIWNCRERKREAKIQSNGGACGSIDFSPDGSRLATIGFYDAVRVWDCQDWREVWSSPPRTGFIGTGWSAEGETLFGLTLDGTIHAWRTVPKDQILGQVKRIDSLMKTSDGEK
ncbi:MAG: protein kinase [Planctomycetales bacterium]|nr:protein kinase [Planctomycetales bacterium]